MTMPEINDDHERFVMEFVRAEQSIHSYILSLMPQWADAEEVLQQTSLILWRKFSTYESGTSFLHWACKIARYEALNFRKKHRRDRHIFSDELLGILADEGLGEAERLHEERRALSVCLRRLKQGHRDMVHRCYMRGASIKDVAREMGRSANSLYKSLDRIRQKLMECIHRTLTVEDC